MGFVLFLLRVNEASLTTLTRRVQQQYSVSDPGPLTMKNNRQRPKQVSVLNLKVLSPKSLTWIIFTWFTNNVPCSTCELEL